MGAMPTCYCLLLAMSSQLSVLSKLCVMNTLLYYLLLFQFCRSLRNISLGDCILGKSNVFITVGWLRRRHQRATLFSLASVPPNPKPTTGHKIKKFIKKMWNFLWLGTDSSLQSKDSKWLESSCHLTLTRPSFDSTRNNFGWPWLDTND